MGQRIGVAELDQLRGAVKVTQGYVHARWRKDPHHAFVTSFSPPLLGKKPFDLQRRSWNDIDIPCPESHGF